MSIKNEIDRIKSAKTAISEKIAAKGVTVPSGVKIDDLPALVESIPEATAPKLQAKSVVPTKSTQVIIPDSDYDGLSKVTVSAISSMYIQPSGTKSITSNGTHDVKSYASVSVNVASSGGGESCTLTVSGMGTGASVQALGADGSVINATKEISQTLNLSLMKNSIFYIYWGASGFTASGGITKVYQSGRYYFGRITAAGTVAYTGGA